MQLSEGELAILTYFTGDHRRVAAVTVDNKNKYCQKFGFKHIIQSDPYHDHQMYHGCDRLIMVRDLFFKEENYLKYIWVLDVHTLMMNFNINVADFLGDENSLFITKDNNGAQINGGSFILKKSEWTKKWLDTLIDEGPGLHPWHDQQAAINNSTKSEFKDKIKYLDQETINSYYYDLYGWSKDTFGQYSGF